MCEAGVMDKLLVLAQQLEGGDREAVLKLVNDKYMMDIKQHFLSHLPTPPRVSPPYQAMPPLLHQNVYL